MIDVYIQAFLTEIVKEMLKDSFPNHRKRISKVFLIYSTFEYAMSFKNILISENKCDSLSSFGHQVVSGILSAKAIDKLLERKEEAIEVSFTRNGVEIFSTYTQRFMLPKNLIKTPTPSRWEQNIPRNLGSRIDYIDWDLLIDIVKNKKNTKLSLLMYEMNRTPLWEAIEQGNIDKMCEAIYIGSW